MSKSQIIRQRKPCNDQKRLRNSDNTPTPNLGQRSSVPQQSSMQMSMQRFRTPADRFPMHKNSRLFEDVEEQPNISSRSLPNKPQPLDKPYDAVLKEIAVGINPLSDVVFSRNNKKHFYENEPTLSPPAVTPHPLRLWKKYSDDSLVQKIPNVNLTQHMCYWCSIRIENEKSFESSGPNHMPVGSDDFISIESNGSVLNQPDVIDHTPTHESGNLVDRSANATTGGFPKAIGESPLKEVPVTNIQNFTSRDSILFTPFVRNNINPQQNQMLKSNSSPFFVLQDESPEVMHGEQGKFKSQDSSNKAVPMLSEMLNANLKTYLDELSSVHSLYKSASSTKDAHGILALSEKLPSSMSLLHSPPLLTYLTSVDPILQKELHKAGKVSELVVTEYPTPLSSKEHNDNAAIAATLIIRPQQSIEKEHILSSQLLDAWWRLRLYLLVGHEKPWSQRSASLT